VLFYSSTRLLDIPTSSPMFSLAPRRQLLSVSTQRVLHMVPGPCLQSRRVSQGLHEISGCYVLYLLSLAVRRQLPQLSSTASRSIKKTVMLQRRKLKGHGLPTISTIKVNTNRRGKTLNSCYFRLPPKFTFLTSYLFICSGIGEYAIFG
jgi:hypothetical protein